MKQHSVYAVVDIETTGTSVQMDRIIQIGCVFIQDGEVIDRFVTDLNPRIKLSKQIESLTHISNEQLANAPYFEDIAAKLFELLKDTVFVAHNIFFDYQFLSAEFERAGFPGMMMPGMDTVELAQIFIPTLPSYRLSDIADQFDFSHDRPHQADSDAFVTGQLFMMIQEEIRKIPLVTLEKIISLADVLAMETRDFLMLQLEIIQKHLPPLREDVQVVHGLALKKKVDLVGQYPAKPAGEFPRNREGKEAVYGEFLDYRESQGQMMNDIFDFFTSTNFDVKNLSIESPTGSGKTFAYLFPLSYKATVDNPLIVSTISIVLENQLLKEAVPLVNKVNPDCLQATVIKSSKYFIDLTKFAATLANPLKQKQYALYQMRCLVWLLETDTGDMSELNLSNLDHVFFSHVRHLGEKYVTESSPYYDEDFWLFLKKKVRQSNVLIVNHAFLIKETFREFPWLPASEHLIIDEAHHFPEIAERLGYRHLNFLQLKSSLFKLIHFHEQEPEWKKITKDQGWPLKNKLLERTALETINVLEIVQDDIIETALIDSAHQFDDEILLTSESLDNLPIYLNQDIFRLNRLLQDLVNLIAQGQDYITEELDKWLISEQLTLQNWQSLGENLIENYHFIDSFLTSSEEQSVRWLKIEEKQQNVYLYTSEFLPSSADSSAWYDRYDKILFTGGTLKIGNDTQYLAKNLGIDSMPFIQFPTLFDFSTQARFYVPEESLSFSDLSSAYYEKYLIDSVLSFALNIPVKMLVLFTSHEMLQNVYHGIQPKLLNHNIEVLGQGLSGSRERIMKRFTGQGRKVLLGADSFWEGIDLPGDALQLIVVARLPFESPERPFVKEKLKFLQQQGMDGFQQYSLPKAVLRLRQGIGRLLRTKEDRGAVVMMDPRIVKARYAKKIQSALPEGLSLTEQSFENILKDLKNFL
ncbi:helicase C-terminal domain-containing protein [Vagococcus elongatus]|uniref:3'-5' exonuclease DinG n=1 Tax=Vagococcus elongatus TaxID=180344 RepID=A0A430B5K1_9ENTE|nr:helicase C-terminal domain-containing protein [Vagococcus elongatus]RSU15557.1 hypothetical protein CBF29_00330 [Vagococcus elongatus]